MSETGKPASPVSPLKPSDGPPESPTTARALDFDSDQEGGLTTPPKNATTLSSAPKPPPKDEAPPPKPPRPINPREQAENTLREAFPSIDASVIKAVLAASGGSVEPAFNALLGMSDPDSQKDLEPPPKPPRPTNPPTSTQRSQMEEDERLARQLHERYSNATTQQMPRGGDRYNEQLRGSRVGRSGSNPDPDNVPWRSFIDDDLPEIRDNIKKGFLETQTTVNKWITTFKKKLDGEDDESDFSSQPPRPAQNYGGSQRYGGAGGRRSSDMTRRSADLQRYDADPQEIGDDFSKLELKDGDHPPRMSSRPLANPNLFKPGTGSATSAARRVSPGSGRKVSFQDGPPEEIRDMYSASPKPAGATATTTAASQQPSSTAKSSKWQPMASIDPSPVADNDPFSLGDSDEERDAKPITLKDDELDSPQKATTEAMKDTVSGDDKSNTKK